MRIANLQDSLEGCLLALPIHGIGGRLMLSHETRLTKNLIRVLKAHGYTKVAVKDPIAGEITPDDAIRPETRIQAEKALDSAVCKLTAGQVPDINALNNTVDAIIADLRENSGVCDGICSIRSYDQNTYTHSINTCILSLLIADYLRWPLDRLRMLGIGALLHDIGKILMPVHILNKPARLTEEEYELIKTHTSKGQELLSDCFDTGLGVARIAVEHHERMDGSGYPKGLKGPEISDFGKIISVADVYDAMSTDRPHRRAIFPEAVYAHMVEGKDTLFEASYVDCLFSKVALYPAGTILSLFGGYVAVVTEQDPRSNFRPFARIVRGPGITQPVDISLYEREDVKINLLLDDYPSDTQSL